MLENTNIICLCCIHVVNFPRGQRNFTDKRGGPPICLSEHHAMRTAATTILYTHVLLDDSARPQSHFSWHPDLTMPRPEVHDIMLEIVEFFHNTELDQMLFTRYVVACA